MVEKVKKINFEVELQVELTKKSIICYNAKSVNLILGSSSAASNTHIYNIKRLSNPMRWEVPIKEVKKRIAEKQINIQKQIQNLDIMLQSVISFKGEKLCKK